MSVTSVSSSVSHYYSGATRTFPYTFRIVSSDDLVVTVLPFGSDFSTPLTLGTQYSVTGVNFYSGGNITINDSVTLSVGSTIRIKRAIKTYTQDTIFRNQGAFYAATVEDALDKLTMMSQELKLKIDSVPTFPDTEVATDYTFPEPILGGFFKWATRTVGTPPVTEYYIATDPLASGDLPVIPLSKGGTGAISAAAAWTSIGIPNIATALPLSDGTSASVGTSIKFAREDHQHARPTLVDLNAAARGANTDITSVGLTSGTVSTAPATATAIANKAYVDGYAAARGANTDITSVALTSGTVSTPPATATAIANRGYVDGYAAAKGANTDITSVALTSGTVSTPPATSAAIANRGFVEGYAAAKGANTDIASVELTSGTVSITPATATAIANRGYVESYAASKGANTNITSVALTSGTVSTAPTASTDIANKLYVDTLSQGINFHQAVNVATLANLASTVSGNILTSTTTNTALVIDGVTVALGQRVLVKNQTASNENGIYTLTRNFGVGIAWQLTRAIDYDSVGSGPDQVTAGDFVLVLSGTTLSNTAWVLQTTGTIVLNTTGLTFTQFASASQPYSAGTGLTLTGNVFSLPTVPLTLGGTGQITRQAGINALAGATTARTFLRGDGANVTMATIQVADLPTGIYSAGTGLTLTGSVFSLPTVPLTLGGTGQTTRQLGINALAGATTAGTFLRGDGTNVAMSAIQLSDLPAGAGGGTLDGDVTGQSGANTVSKLGGYTLTVGTPSDFSTFVFNRQTNAIEMGTRMSDLLGYSPSQPSVNIGVGSLVRQQASILATGTANLVVVSTGSPAVRTGVFAIHHGLVYRAQTLGNVVAQFTATPSSNVLTISAGTLNFSGYAVIGGIAEFTHQGSLYKISVTGWTGTTITLAQAVGGSASGSVTVSITHPATTKFSNSVINGYMSRFVDSTNSYQTLNFYPKYFTDDTDSFAGTSNSRSTVNYKSLYFEIDTDGTYPSFVGGTLTTFGSSNIAIGAGAGAAVTSGNRNILIGPNSDVGLGADFENVVIGNEATVVGNDNVAVGSNANAQGSAEFGAIAIGQNSQGNTGVAVGSGANVVVGTAVGTSAFARNGGVAVGTGATVQTDATQAPPVAVGQNAVARSGQTVVGAQNATSPIDFRKSPRTSYYGTGTSGTNTITLSGTDFDGLSVDMQVSISGATSGVVIITAINGAVITLSRNLINNVVAGVDRIVVTHPFAVGCDGSATGALLTKLVSITAGSNIVTMLGTDTTSGLKVGALFAPSYGFDGAYFASGSVITFIDPTYFTVSGFAYLGTNSEVVFDTRVQLQARGYVNNSMISIIGNYASRIPIGACLIGLSITAASFTKVLKTTYNPDALIGDVEGITYATISRYVSITSGAVFFQRQDYRVVSNCSISNTYAYQNILQFGSVGHPTNVSLLNIVQIGDKVTIDRTKPVICFFSRNITAANTTSNQITFTSVKGMLVGMVIESIGGTGLSPFLTITAINTSTKTVTLSGNSPYNITSVTASTIRGTNMFALGWNPTWDNATVLNTISSPAGFSIDRPIDLGISQIDLMFTPASGGVALGANSFAINNELALGSVGVRFSTSSGPSIIAGWLPVTAAGIESFVPLYFRPSAG